MDVVQYQLPGEHKTNLLIYLLKMNTKYSIDSRINFQQFLEENNLFHVLKKNWNELSKSYYFFF